MALRSAIAASVALGLFLTLIWGVKYIDLEKVASYFPKDQDAPALRGQTHKECPCKAARERCINEDGQRNTDQACVTLWRECAAKKQEWRNKHEGGFGKKKWWACKVAKTRCMNSGEKNLKGRCGFVWKKCEEEVKENKGDVDTKDCYFDKECHKLVDWKKIGAVKGGIIARLKVFKNDEAKAKNVMKRAHELFKEAGMPEDRIDYILEKWAKYAASKPQDNKGGSWFFCGMAKKRCVKDGAKVFQGRCKFAWEKCGEEVAKHAKKSDLKPDAEGCYDKGEHGVWCPKGDGWYCKQNCKKPRADGCYDKGEHGVWCPKGDSWYCKENCKKEEMKPKPDADGCYDKGEHGVWCPKDGHWYCKENCKKEEMKPKPDADGCYDKGEHGVWCPKDGHWYCKENCKKEEMKPKPDADGCYDKGEHGVWCPKDGDWYCKKNCEKLKPDADGCYDKGKYGVWCPKGNGKWFCKSNCKK